MNNVTIAFLVGCLFGAIVTIKVCIYIGLIRRVIDCCSCKKDYDRITHLIAAITNHEIDVWWYKTMEGKYLPMINCNDIFAWACSDAEPILLSDLPALNKAFDDCPYDGELLFICRKRKMRPQNAVYAGIDKEYWPLFDEAGPPRAMNFSNPVSDEDREGYKERTQERRQVTVESCPVTWKKEDS